MGLPMMKPTTKTNRRAGSVSPLVLWAAKFLPLLALAFLLSAETAQAQDWMFRRSYYSHAYPPEYYAQFPPPDRRTAYRPAFRATTPGFGIRGVYRYNRIQLGQGQNSDITLYRQGWFEVQP